MSIGTRKCRNRGNAAHELGHALGLWHEHTRPDRDTYIRINWDNIYPDYRHNFQRSQHEGVPDVGYDFESIMHYSEYAFSSSTSRKTIEAIYPMPACMRKMGQRTTLSFLDALRMSHMYNCTGIYKY